MSSTSVALGKRTVQQLLISVLGQNAPTVSVAKILPHVTISSAKEVKCHTHRHRHIVAVLHVATVIVVYQQPSANGTSVLHIWQRNGIFLDIVDAPSVLIANVVSLSQPPPLKAPIPYG